MIFWLLNSVRILSEVAFVLAILAIFPLMMFGSDAIGEWVLYFVLPPAVVWSAVVAGMKRLARRKA